MHRNVSRLAQDSLNALGITLVLNVKMQVMERIARCTNADILTAVDAYVETTKLGTCSLFYTKDYTLKNGTLRCFFFFFNYFVKRKKKLAVFYCYKLYICL